MLVSASIRIITFLHIRIYALIRPFSSICSGVILNSTQLLLANLVIVCAYVDYWNFSGWMLITIRLLRILVACASSLSFLRLVWEFGGMVGFDWWFFGFKFVCEVFFVE